MDIKHIGEDEYFLFIYLQLEKGLYFSPTRRNSALILGALSFVMCAFVAWMQKAREHIIDLYNEVKL